MRWPWVWWREQRSGGGVEEARRERLRAEEMLRNAEALGAEVRLMGAVERRQRERNHFADLLGEAFGGGEG